MICLGFMYLWMWPSRTLNIYRGFREPFDIYRGFRQTLDIYHGFRRQEFAPACAAKTLSFYDGRPSPCTPPHERTKNVPKQYKLIGFQRGF